jgi:hypothetical protein
MHPYIPEIETSVISGSASVSGLAFPKELSNGLDWELGTHACMGWLEIHSLNVFISTLTEEKERTENEDFYCNQFKLPSFFRISSSLFLLS